MKRIVVALDLLAMLVAGVLLMNVTAPNPTGRRYSSTVVTLQGSSQTIGQQGEEAIARDLGIANNNSTMQCFCKSSRNLGNCNVCLVEIPGYQQNRRPDFITDRYIVEVKNRDETLYSSARDMDQLNDYIIAALTLNRPLWVFVRVDTEIPESFQNLLQKTGGGVVPYLTVPGYVDRTDVGAGIALAVSGALLALMGWRAMRGWLAQPHPISPVDGLPKARQKVEAAEAFLSKAKDDLRRKMDIEDSRWD